MQKKVIIFDMDGVLFDTTAVATRHLSFAFPDITDEIQKELLTGNFHEEISKLSLKRRVETDEEKEERKVRYAKEKAESAMYDGIHELLHKLHNEGYIIALNTSAYERNCLPLLENVGITHMFDFLGTADISKSKVEKFQIIKDKYGVNQKDVIFITDTLGDLREADIAGVPTVAVTWGAHSETYFYRETHNNLLKVISSVSELEDFIANY